MRHSNEWVLLAVALLTMRWFSSGAAALDVSHETIRTGVRWLGRHGRGGTAGRPDADEPELGILTAYEQRNGRCDARTCWHPPRTHRPLLLFAVARVGEMCESDREPSRGDPRCWW